MLPSYSLAAKALGPRARRALWLAALARGVERVVTGVAVLALGAAPTTPGIVLGGAIVVVMMAVRSLASVRSDLLVRKDLYLAVAESLADADAMRPVPLPGGDAEGALSDAVYSGTRVLGSALPFLVGDAVATLALGALAVSVLDWRVIALALVVLVVVVAASIASSREVVRTEATHVEALLAVHAGLGELLERREEIAATGTSRAACTELEKQLDAWQKRALTARLAASAGARLPLGLGVVLVVAAMLAHPPLRSLLEAVDARGILALVAVAPVVLGLFRGALDLRRAAPELAVLRRLLDLPRLERGGTAIPRRAPESIRASDVSFAYGKSRVLRGVSFDWNAGAVLVLAGPNGAGKSTMLRLLLGLARPAQGKILVDGSDLFDFDLAELRKHVAYVPQRPTLSKRRSVRELLSDVPGGDAGALAALVDLGFAADTPSSFLDRAMATLSAGQAQRVLLARAFASSRPLLFLDEPDANLDERSIECLAARLGVLCADRMIALAAHHPKLLACASRLVTLEPPT